MAKPTFISSEWAKIYMPIIRGMPGSREVDPAASLEYRIKRAPAAHLGAPAREGWTSELWQAADVLEITNWEWPNPQGPENGPQGLHRPKVQCKLLYDEKFLAVRFQVEDHFVQCRYDKWQDGVCRDSCCEFFISPQADSDDKTPFFNFECNAGGAMLLYHCTRGEAGNVEVDSSTVEIPLAASLVETPGLAGQGGTKIVPEITEPTTWGIEYHVPLELFNKYTQKDVTPASGTVWRGNVYKCADQTSHPHWGSWAPVGTPRPNFHRPSGKIPAYPRCSAFLETSLLSRRLKRLF